MNGPKIYFTIPILGGIPITQTSFGSFLVMVILCVTGWLIGRKLTKRPGRFQVVVEKLVTMLYNMVEDTMGKHNSHWTPYIGALFLSSIFGSYLGMTGFFRSVTADLSTTITWALMTSVLVWVNSIKNDGFWPWFKNLLNPLNLVSEISQPVSMAFRHFGNIAGGGVLMSLLYTALSTGSAAVIGLVRDSHIAVALVVLVLGGYLLFRGFQKKKLVPKIFGALFAAVAVLSLLEQWNVVSGIPILSLGVPGVLSLYFDVFSGGVQALVFSLLTMVFVGNACPPPKQEPSTDA